MNNERVSILEYNNLEILDLWLLIDLFDDTLGQNFACHFALHSVTASIVMYGATINFGNLCYDLLQLIEIISLDIHLTHSTLMLVDRLIIERTSYFQNTHFIILETIRHHGSSLRNYNDGGDFGEFLGKISFTPAGRCGRCDVFLCMQTYNASQCLP